MFAVLATDVAIFTIKDKELMVRLICVDRVPQFKGMLGLPGCLISPAETAEETVERLIEEKGAVSAKKVYYEQLYTFSSLDRDPRGRVVSVGYIALVPWEELSQSEQSDVRALWAPISKAKKLAYDHDQILSHAIKRLRSRITYTTISSQLVPKKFTLTRLEQVFETVLGKEIDKRNFRKKLIALDIVRKSPEKIRGVRHRPASLHYFSSSAIKEIDVL